MSLRLKLKNAQKMKKNERKHVWLIHARIGPAQIDGLIMRSSLPRLAERKTQIFMKDGLFEKPSLIGSAHKKIYKVKVCIKF